MLLRKKLFYVLWNGSQQLDTSFCGRFESKANYTSKIEHHAVLYTVQALQKIWYSGRLCAVKPNGEIDITNLVELLAENQNTGEPDACQ
jgi:hypothetical protein